ncbi:hypothetical protein F3Y22_tig00110403pilonHSYRG00188 [Hibiscus syriacus]|uniref:R13L1/DRL21-like LRR repeat region domain-containing protein n=1 Tax=Hibiscus syriacus TaxID=106335 RepID=A0A6A3ANL3_HIBSY|nr:hypothetical protein F3Y22_tig00110403pilonHSYRG00188 [Hibiscus syriacus]
MYLGIGNLTNLQRLSDFVIGDGDGHRIGELKNLSNLRGDICLSGLENVNGQDEREVRLSEKSGINTLALHWSRDFEKPTRKDEVDERVLESLHPPKKLEQLVFVNFGGAKFPTWIADSSFKYLSSLKLFSCKNCKSLPSIRRDCVLRVYQTWRTGTLVKVMSKFQSFPAFVSFISEDVLNCWEGCQPVFSPCRNLISKSAGGLGKLSHLQEISLWDCSNLMVCFEEIESPLTNLKGFPASLASLSISDAPKIYTSLVEWGFHRLTSLQRLEISGEECSNVVSFPEERMGMAALPPPLTSIRI